MQSKIIKNRGDVVLSQKKTRCNVNPELMWHPNLFIASSEFNR
jgi:hypothetical protein